MSGELDDVDDELLPERRSLPGLLDAIVGVFLIAIYLIGVLLLGGIAVLLSLEHTDGVVIGSLFGIGWSFLYDYIFNWLDGGGD